MTFDMLNDWFPVWFPDSDRIFFGSNRAGSASRIFRKAGSGPEEAFLGGEDNDNMAVYPNDTSSDGQFLSYTQLSPRGYDLGVAQISGEATEDCSLPRRSTRSRRASRRTAGGSRMPPMNQASSRCTFVRFQRRANNG